MKQFLIEIVIITVLLAITGWVVYSQIIPQYYIPILPFLISFFALISIIIHAIQLNMVKKNFAKFSRSNMLLTFLKLVFYTVFAIVYFVTDKENAKIFIVNFMLLYIIYTVFEVYTLIGITNNRGKGA